MSFSVTVAARFGLMAALAVAIFALAVTAPAGTPPGARELAPPKAAAAPPHG